MPRRGGRTPLVVTLCKPAGGSHNRIWSLHIREGNVWQPDETWSDFEDLEDWPPRAGELTTVRASDDNENCLTAIFNLRHPGFWYRETPRGYQFLIHQHEHPHVGDQRCLDGYYTWTERDAWRHSDKNGTPGEPLKR